MSGFSNNKSLITLIIVIIIGLCTYKFLTTPDQRTATDRLGDAIHALPQGVDKAARQLQPRTPGQKLGDAVKDAGDDIKRDTAPSSH